MSELHHLWESTVTPDQIDGLGHMNTRYYSINAQRASGRLLHELGMGSDYLESGPDVLGFPDVYIRYHNEQLEGAPLAVRGGVLDAHETSLRVYLELVNRATEAVAATFVQDVELQERGSRRPRRIPAEARARASAETVAIPGYAQPRTLSLDPPRTDVSMAALERRGLRLNAQPLLLTPEWCDEAGFLRIDDSNTLFMVVHGIRRDANKPMRDNNFRTRDGLLLGWAMMESRQVQVRLPRQGESVVSYQAHTLIHDKVHSTTRWIFQAESGELCAVMQTVTLAFDIDARRPIPIPEAEREDLLASYHPDLA
ncbi:MAG: thioesterase family protein [Pseudomonadota bacterium]